MKWRTTYVFPALIVTLTCIMACGESLTHVPLDGQQSGSLNKNDSRSADLRLEVKASNLTPVRGEVLAIPIEIINNGPDLTTQIRVAAAVPKGLDLQGFRSTRTEEQQGTCRTCGYNDSLGVWIVGHLPRDSSSTLELITEVTAMPSEGPILFRADVINSLLPDPDTEDNSSSIVIEPVETRR